MVNISFEIWEVLIAPSLTWVQSVGMEPASPTTRYSIAELKSLCASSPLQAVAHAQIESVLLKPTKQGGAFLEMKLSDGAEAFVLRVWGDSSQFPMAQRLRPLSFVEVTAEWSVNQYGLEPRNWTMRALTEEETASLLAGPPALREKQTVDYTDILDLVSKMRDPRLRSLCELFLNDFGDRFRRAAAAREYHHARRGGLVEHVAQMMRTANVLCDVYPANRDLLLTGVLFHDCGKLWENCYPAEGFNMPYSEHGEMLGHITLGIELVNKLWRKLLDADAAEAWLQAEPTNEDVRLHLLHLIASHHGEYQFGSPVLPKTPEAILLHHVDNIDAKWEMFTRAYSTSAFLAKNIQERVRPLPTNVVLPLAIWSEPAVVEEPLPND